MFEKISSYYKCAQLVSPIFDQMFKAAEKKNIRNFNESILKITNYLNEAYKSLDIELISCILHYQLIFTQYLSQNARLLILSELLELDSIQILVLNEFIKLNDETKTIKFLIKNLDKYTFKHISEKEKRLSFKQQVFDKINPHLNNHKNPAPIKLIIESLKNSIFKQDSKKSIALLICICQELENYLYNNDPQNFAALFYDFNTTLKLNCQVDSKISLEQSYLIKFIFPWLFTYMLPIYQNASNNYKIPYHDLLQFRKSVVNDISKKPTIDLLPFQKSLDDFQASINNFRISEPEFIISLYEIFITLHEDVMLNTPEKLASHFQQILNIIDNQSIQEILKINKIIPEIADLNLSNNECYLQAKKLITLKVALHLITKLCHFSGMTHKDTYQFIQDFSINLETILGFSIIDDENNFIEQLKSAINLPSLKYNIINQLSISTISQELYFTQDIKRAANWIKKLADFAILNNHQQALTELIKSFKFDPLLRYQLIDAINRNDKSKLLKILVEAHTNFMHHDESCVLSVKQFKEHIFVELSLSDDIKVDTDLLTWKMDKLQTKNSKIMFEFHLICLQLLISQNNIDNQKYEFSAYTNRIHLYDLVFSENDIDLYCEIFKYDIQLLNKFISENKYLEIANFLNLSHEAFTELTRFQKQFTKSDIIIWYMLENRVDDKNIFLLFDSSQKDTQLFAFKAKAYQILSDGIEQTDFTNFCAQYEEALIQINHEKLDFLNLKWKLLFHDSLYKLNTHQICKMLIDFFQIFNKHFNQTPELHFNLLSQINMLTDLNPDITYLLIEKNQLNYIYWHAIQKQLKQNPKYYIDKNILKIFEELNLYIDQASFSANLDLLPTTEIILNNFDLSDFKILRLKIDVLLQNGFYSLNGVNISKTLLYYTDICKKLFQNARINELKFLMLSVLSGMANELWRDNLIDLELPMHQELLNFVMMVKELNYIINRYSNQIGGCKETQVDFYKSIYQGLNIDKFMQIQIEFNDFQAYPWVFTETIEILFEYAVKIKDKDYFVILIKKMTDFINESYSNKKIDNILNVFDINNEKINQLNYIKAINYNRGLHYWLINHYIQQNIAKNSEDIQEILTFKTEIFKSMAISSEDLVILDSKKISALIKNNDFEQIFLSIRYITNQKIDITIFTEIFAILAKIPELNSLLKKHYPTSDDDDCYHQFHAIMSGIWHIHTVVHIFSPIKTTYILNNVEVNGEGSFKQSMLYYLREAFHNSPKIENYIDIIHKKYFKNLDATTALEMREEIYFTLFESVIDNVKNIKNLLNSNKIIALPVSLNQTLGLHAVSLVFWKNKIIITDRGNPNNFSGMKIYEVRNTDNNTLDNVLSKLYQSINQPISEDDYQKLQEKLNLKLLEKIELDPQVIGNCGMASQAEPIILSILYFKYHDWAKKTKRNEDDSNSLAEYLAKEMLAIVKEDLEYQSLHDLIIYFNNCHVITDLPKDLIGHIYLIAMHKLKNFKIVSFINQQLSINNIIIDKALNNIKLYFKSFLENNIPYPAKAKLNPEQLNHEAHQLTNYYLDNNISQQQLNNKLKSTIYKLSGISRDFSGVNLISMFNNLTPQSLIKETNNNKDYQVNNIKLVIL